MRRPALRFSPTAWAKLLCLRDEGPTEVGGFGITSAEDLLYVEDICLVSQTCSVVSVKFDDVAVAEFFETQVDAGRKPEQFARIWIHTHPGDSPSPSHVDERTFGRVFGRCEWSLMFILAQGGQTYARIRYGVGPGGSLEIPTTVDFKQPFAASDLNAWQHEYAASVRPLTLLSVSNGSIPAIGDNALAANKSADEFFFDQCTRERSDLAYDESF